MVNLSGFFSCGSGAVIGRAVFGEKNNLKKKIIEFVGGGAGEGGGG